VISTVTATVTATAAVKAISSRDNPLLARLRRLAGDPAGYRKLGEILLEGDHLCAAFAARGMPAGQAVITDAAWEVPAMRELAKYAAAVAVIPPALMRGITTLESATPIAFVVPYAGSSQLMPSAPSVVLDRLQDAGNVGTIMRTAAALGFTQIVAIKGTAALWSPKVLRAGMGAHFSLSLVEGLASTEGLDVPLIATSLQADTYLHEAELPWPCAWVMGNEGQGVGQALLDRCKLAVRILQPGGEESLNVASAAAICLYESARRRL